MTYWKTIGLMSYDSWKTTDTEFENSLEDEPDEDEEKPEEPEDAETETVGVPASEIEKAERRWEQRNTEPRE